MFPQRKSETQLVLHFFSRRKSARSAKRRIAREYAIYYPVVITRLGEILVSDRLAFRYNPLFYSGGNRGEADPILDDTGLSNLLGLLYEAASDPTLWTPFLESVAKQVGGSGAGIVSNDSEHRAVALNAGLSPEFLALYRQYYHSVDIWGIRGVPQILRSPGDWVSVSEALCPWEEFRNTEFYNDFSLPGASLAHAMFAVIKREHSRVTNLSVYRTTDQGPFGTQELRVLKLLSPHLRRAFRLHFQLTSLQDRNRSFDMLLDSLLQGIILLGSSGAVIHMNRAARQLCEACDGLLASTSGLAAESPVESAKLQALIGQATSTSLGDGLSAGGGLLISRKSRPPLNIVVSPVRNLATDFRETVRTIVYVTDPSLRIRPRNELLETIYGLTPAECRVALLMADGLSTSSIREMAGITANTLRTHLASIYRKTNTARQTQLVKLISLIGMTGTTNPA